MKALLAATAIALFSTAAMAVPPGSGNWGGGPGNSGPGDKNGQNEQGGGGQTPPGQDDKLFVPAPEFVIATHTGDHESPTDRDNGGGNDPNSKAPGQTTNPNPGK